jgi:hypothetical protein
MMCGIACHLSLVARPALVAVLSSLTDSYRHNAKALIALCNQDVINRGRPTVSNAADTNTFN